MRSNPDHQLQVHYAIDIASHHPLRADRRPITWTLDFGRRERSPNGQSWSSRSIRRGAQCRR
jgi:hypothetical protein